MAFAEIESRASHLLLGRPALERRVSERMLALLARAFPEGVPVGEAAFLEGLAPDRAEMVLARLEAVLDAERGGVAPLAELARRAGVARQKLFDLRRRWRDDRSVRSLTPYASAPPRGAVDRGGSRAAMSVAERLVAEAPDYHAASDIARRIVREAGSVDHRTALRLVRRLRHAASVRPSYLASNYGRTVLVDVCAVDVPLLTRDPGLALAALVMDRASLLVLGAAAGLGGDMADLQATAMSRAIGRLADAELDIAADAPGRVVLELVVADGYSADVRALAELGARPGFDVADEGPRRFGRRAAGLLDYKLGGLRMLPGFTVAADGAGAGARTSRQPMEPWRAEELLLSALERHNGTRLRALGAAAGEGLRLARDGTIAASLREAARAMSIDL